MPTNDDLQPEHEHDTPVDTEHPGYELTDVNISGIAVFLVGLFGTVLIFFGVCFMLGRIINGQFAKQDGPQDKWHQDRMVDGPTSSSGKRENLASNPELQQKQLSAMTSSFPMPRLDIDDGNQAVADLHAREDLLLDHYSTIDGGNGAIRIPITRAMQLIAQRGLPVVQSTVAPEQLAGDVKPQVQAPLTTGFARTGYELDVIEVRAEKMSYSKAEGSASAELAPPK